MKICVKVHSNSSQEKIELNDKGYYEVWIREKPIDGKANLELTRLLKKYFKKNVEIVSGSNSRRKVVEII